MDSTLYWLWLAEALGSGCRLAGRLLEEYPDLAELYGRVKAGRNPPEYLSARARDFMQAVAPAQMAGLKKRWTLYNNWLAHNGIDPVSVDDVDMVFTVALPIDEAQIVSMVCTLKNAGLVDDQTLLSLLWFVKDPAEAVENMKQQKQENQQQYMDSFAAKAEDKADEKGQSADQEQQDKEKDV